MFKISVEYTDGNVLEGMVDGTLIAYVIMGLEANDNVEHYVIDNA